MCREARMRPNEYMLHMRIYISYSKQIANFIGMQNWYESDFGAVPVDVFVLSRAISILFLKFLMHLSHFISENRIEHDDDSIFFPMINRSISVHWSVNGRMNLCVQLIDIPLLEISVLGLDWMINM